jgi:hypothetical protein
MLNVTLHKKFNIDLRQGSLYVTPLIKNLDLNLTDVRISLFDYVAVCRFVANNPQWDICRRQSRLEQ